MSWSHGVRVLPSPDTFDIRPLSFSQGVSYRAKREVSRDKDILFDGEESRSRIMTCVDRRSYRSDQVLGEEAKECGVRHVTQQELILSPVFCGQRRGSYQRGPSVA